MSRIKTRNDLQRIGRSLEEIGQTMRGLSDFAPVNCKRPEDRQFDFDYGFGLTYHAQRGWGIQCSVDVRVDLGEEVTLEDGTIYRAFTPRIELGWSTTGRTIACAQASVTLYQEMINFASLIESRLDEYTIYKIQHEPKPAEARQ